MLVTGEILDATSHWYLGVFRYTADGSLDRTFAGGGFAEIDLGEAEFAHAVAVQRNGRIIVAGEADCPLAVCFAWGAQTQRVYRTVRFAGRSNKCTPRARHGWPQVICPALGGSRA